MPKITAPLSYAGKTQSIQQIASFKGIDLTSSISNILPCRSPDCKNMMPDLDGFPVKRPGYSLINSYQGTINGAYSLKLNGTQHMLIHAGENIYYNNNILYTGANNAKSCAVQLQDKLLIADGKRLLVFANFLQNGENNLCIKCADTIGTVPVITIGRTASGGGQSFNPPNILSNMVEEHFLTDGQNTAYQLSYTDLPENGDIEIKICNAGGEWQAVTAFTLNRQSGIINFAAPPPLPVVTGEDNLKVKYQKKQIEININCCNKLVAFGVDGQPDRLFLAGEAEHKNYVRYTQFKDPLYIGDIFYLALGQSKAEITGFSVLQNRLVIHKNGEEFLRNAFVICGKTDADGDAVFPVENVLLGEGALGGFASLLDEPLFLTKQGIFALAKSDVDAERYTQNRSFYINAQLTKSNNLSAAVALCYKRFYILAVDNVMYLLDGEQKSYEKNSPYSTYQYECYLWDNIPATALWQQENELYFGDKNGNVYKFFKPNTPGGYNDCGKAINAYWTTPLLSLAGFNRYKTVNDVWVVCQPYARSGAEVFYASDREYEKLVKSFNIDIFDANNIDFNRFTFNTLTRPVIQHIKRKIKKAKLFQLSVKNNRINEQFGLAAIVIGYLQGGKIK